MDFVIRQIEGLNIINEDLRSVKIEKALFAAVFSLLKSFSFRKLTIKRICEEALVSRAAFYAHYIDKYDLLKHWMNELWPKNLDDNLSYEQIENVVNNHIQENMTILKNLFYDADNETFKVLFDFILSTINLKVDKSDNDGEVHTKKIVLANFYAGGIISYILWQMSNGFPKDVPPMNEYLYEVINELKSRRF